MSIIKLYGSYTSPYVRHIRITLKQLDLEYEFVDADYEYSGANSPCKRVPFLEHNDKMLTDSSSILLYLKQLKGVEGFTNVDDFELYTIANTTMDAEINLFLLERDGLVPDAVPYLARQRQRVESGLAYMDKILAKSDRQENSLTDGEIRLACLLDWADFRNRFELSSYQNLRGFLTKVRGMNAFTQTKPPA